ALRQGPAALAHAPVDRNHVVVAEALYHHEQHRRGPAAKRRLAHALRGGGWPSTLGRSGSKHAHFGADLDQMVAEGAARLGSSSVPARTKIIVGRSSASLKTGVPHREQKRRRMVEPLSAWQT